MDKSSLRRTLIGLVALATMLIVTVAGLVFFVWDGDESGSIRKLTLQPRDLPPGFALSEETIYNRQEFIDQLPAESQAAEVGLKEAVKRKYVSQKGTPLIEAYVYTYKDQDAAAAAQAFAREPKGDEPRHLDLGDGMSGYAAHDALVVEGIGDGAFVMSGSVDYDDGDPNTAADSLSVQIFVMQNGRSRAELLVAGEGMFLDPQIA